MKKLSILLLFTGLLLTGCIDNRVEPDSSAPSSSESSVTESTNETLATIVTEKADFQLWNDSLASYVEETDIFTGFLLAEYHSEGKIYPVLFNAKVQLVFFENHIEIVVKETQEQFCVTLPTCSNGNAILNGYIAVHMCDVNQDDVAEIIVTETQTGTCRIQYVDVIDIQNQKILPLEYKVDELATMLPKMQILEEKKTESGKWDSVVMAYQLQGTEYTHTIDMRYVDTDSLELKVGVLDQDYRECSKNGQITVEAGFGFSVTDSVYIDYVGTLIGTLVYQEKEQNFILDKNSIVIEWATK